MVIVFISDQNNYETITKVVLYDFDLKKWTEIPNLDEKIYGFKLTCAMTAVFDKQATQKALIVVNGNSQICNVKNPFCSL